MQVVVLRLSICCEHVLMDASRKRCNAFTELCISFICKCFSNVSRHSSDIASNPACVYETLLCSVRSFASPPQQRDNHRMIIWGKEENVTLFYVLWRLCVWFGL